MRLAYADFPYPRQAAADPVRRRRVTRRFPISGHAASVVECYPDEVPGWDEDIGIAALLAAFPVGGRKALIVDFGAALDVADGLCDLINGEDDMADANARRNPEMAAMNRAGARGLRTLRAKVLEWARS